jgi:hypothetical protein
MNMDPNINQCVTKIADTIREMIRNEDSLVNQRLTWLALFQGLLFNASAFWARKPDRNRLPICVICGLGIFVALSIWVSTYAAYKATGNLRCAWDMYIGTATPEETRECEMKRDPMEPPILLGNNCDKRAGIQGNDYCQPNVQGLKNPPLGLIGRYAWPGLAVPLIFVLAWLVLAFDLLILERRGKDPGGSSTDPGR